MSDAEQRIKHRLEPVLDLPDPRQQISAYHDMPYALFRYDPQEEFELRKQVTLLETRLSQKGNRQRGKQRPAKPEHGEQRGGGGRVYEPLPRGE